MAARDATRAVEVQEGVPARLYGVVVLAAAICVSAAFCLAVRAAGDVAPTTASSPSPQLTGWTSWVKDAGTVVALAAGAYWFLRRRDRFPRLNLNLHATLERLDQERQLTRVGVELENVGQVMVKVVCAEVWLQQLEPRPPDAIASIGGMEETIRDASNPSAEALWPRIGKRALRFEKGQREIEPGEKDEIWFDFLVDSEVLTALAYVHIENAAKSRKLLQRRKNRAIGWIASRVFTRGGENRERQEVIREQANEGSET